MRRFLFLLLIVSLANICMGQERVRCKGLTKQGNPCKSFFVNKDGWCKFHNPTALHCIKDSCKMVVDKQGDTCWIHKRYFSTKPEIWKTPKTR